MVETQQPVVGVSMHNVADSRLFLPSFSTDPSLLASIAPRPVWPNQRNKVRKEPMKESKKVQKTVRGKLASSESAFSEHQTTENPEATQQKLENEGAQTKAVEIEASEESAHSNASAPSQNRADRSDSSSEDHKVAGVESQYASADAESMPAGAEEESSMSAGEIPHNFPPFGALLLLLSSRRSSLGRYFWLWRSTPLDTCLCASFGGRRCGG
eukprot:2526140-Rhodomonas_salina.1